MINGKVAFIGGGNMTRAIAGGLVDGGFDATDIFIAEPVAAAREALVDQLPDATISGDNNDIAAAASCVVLAVKPQMLVTVCKKLASTVQAHKPLIISVAAGTRSDDIDAWLGGGLAVVRIMPNQPALLRRGVSALYANDRTSNDQRRRAADIIGAVGKVVLVDSEAEIDAATAVSGSGPAYFFLLIEVLSTTAVDLGIAPAAARILAIETARGAAELAAGESAEMTDLIARVRSPGGTTAAALDELDAADVRAIFARAITAARDRAVELADTAHDSQA